VRHDVVHVPGDAGPFLRDRRAGRRVAGAAQLLGLRPEALHQQVPGPDHPADDPERGDEPADELQVFPPRALPCQPLVEREHRDRHEQPDQRLPAGTVGGDGVHRNQRPEESADAGRQVQRGLDGQHQHGPAQYRQWPPPAYRERQGEQQVGQHRGTERAGIPVAQQGLGDRHGRQQHR
jgi:hypothetical protein